MRELQAAELRGSVSRSRFRRIGSLYTGAFAWSYAETVPVAEAEKATMSPRGRLAR